MRIAYTISGQRDLFGANRARNLIQLENTKASEAVAKRSFR